MATYLEITLWIDLKNRAKAVAVYNRYKADFLKNIPGAKSKELLVRDEDVQVLHGFTTADEAKSYLNSRMFKEDVVPALGPLLDRSPEVRVYEVV